MTNTVRAELTAGSKIQPFTLMTPNGRPVSLEIRSGVLHLKRGGNSERPKVLAMHLLQPDCLQCREQLNALQKLHDRFGSKGLVILGISHRGDLAELAGLQRDLRVSFPLLMGTGSELARQFAAGDTFGLIDAQGIVRFAQVGYGLGDERTWEENIQVMLAGKLPAQEGIDRERLQVGDRFPAIVLPSLRTAKPLQLTGQDGKLVFRDDRGKQTQPKGVLFFFSRY